VTFTVTVDTATVPDKTSDPFAYWGAIRAVPTGHAASTLRVPFAFMKAPLLRLHVDETPISVMFLRHGDPLVSRYAWPVLTTSDHLLPVGTYDVVVQYQQPYAYVLQTVELTQTIEVTLPRAAAIHQARIAFTDETGQTAVPNHAFHRFMRGGNGWLVPESAVSEPITEVVRFSDVPATYVWERTVACANPTGDAYRQWHGRAEGISSDIEFLTAPADFARVDHPLRAVPGVTAYNFWELIGYATPNYAYMVGPTAPTVTVPYERRAYYRTPPPGHELYMLRLALPDPTPSSWKDVLLSPWLQLDVDRRLTWQQPRSPLHTYYRVPTGSVEPLGLGPLHWFARFATDAPDSVRLTAAEGSWMYYRAYQGGDVSWELWQPYELWQNGTLVQTDNISSSTGSNSVIISLPVSGTYTMTLPFTYTLGASDVVTAHGRAVAAFDTRQVAADANPPTVEVLRILDATRGQPTDVAVGPVELRLVVTDAVSAPTVTVAYDVGAGWVPVSVTQAGDEYVAQLPGFDDGAAVHLRITAADAAGNTLTHYLEPAYLVVCDPVHNLAITAPPAPHTGVSLAFTATATGAPPIAYAWDFGDGGAGSGITATHTYTTGGDYTVTLTANNCTGAQAQIAESVSVCESVHDVVIHVSTDPAFSNQVVTFTATASGTPPLAYAWDLGDGHQGAGVSVSHAYTATGDYTVTLAVTNCLDARVEVRRTVRVTSYQLYLPLVLRHANTR